MNKLVATVYQKSTFSGFFSILYKFGMIYTLVFRCFQICLDQTEFYYEFSFLKDIYLKMNIAYHLTKGGFLKKKKNNSFLNRSQISTAGNKSLTLLLLFLGKFSLETTIKLKTALKRNLGCYKIIIVSKSQRNLLNVFCFKDSLPL